MTEIDMARQYGHNMEVEFIDNKDAFNIGYKAFLAGLKASRLEWHDLRKNPNDLPEKINFISKTVVNQIGTPCHYNYDLKCWQNWSYIKIDTPIVWCEIPKFKDIE